MESPQPPQISVSGRIVIEGQLSAPTSTSPQNVTPPPPPPWWKFWGESPQTVLAIATILLAAATVVLFLIAAIQLWAEHNYHEVEEARAVNLALSRLEQAIDNHPDAGPCLRYVTNTKVRLGEPIAKHELIHDFPSDPPDAPGVRELCFGGLLIQMQKTDITQIPDEVKSSYIRHEVYSVLNALEEASTFNTDQNKYYKYTQEDDDAHSGPGEDENRQRELRRQIRSFAGSPDRPVIEMIKIDNRLVNEELDDIHKRRIDNISHVCRILNCE